ncbi:MAG: hypothetical protein ABW217_21090, partial [Polyangiaceae bacterium]
MHTRLEQLHGERAGRLDPEDGKNLRGRYDLAPRDEPRKAPGRAQAFARRQKRSGPLERNAAWLC